MAKDQLQQINFADDEVLDLFTDKLADFIEHEASRELYEAAIEKAVREHVERLKLPRWASFLKGPIIGWVVGWLLEYGSSLLVSMLRGVAKKQ